MSNVLTSDKADANEISKSHKTYQIFQHQENGRRYAQRTMHIGQYWVFNI